MEVADDLPESPAPARSERPTAGAPTGRPAQDTDGCGATPEPATGSATGPAADSAAVPAARTAAVPAARSGRRRPIRHGGGLVGGSALAEGPRCCPRAQLAQPLGQRQGGGRDKHGNDDRVPVCELHAGHVGCQVRITRSDGRDALAGVLAAVQHRQEVRAGDSVVRTDLTVRWSDDSLVHVAVEAGEMLSINPKKWLRDTVEPPAPTHVPRAQLSAPPVVGRHSAAG